MQQRCPANQTLYIDCSIKAFQAYLNISGDLSRLCCLWSLWTSVMERSIISDRRIIRTELCRKTCQMSTWLELLEWKQRWLIGREYTNNLSKHLSRMLKRDSVLLSETVLKMFSQCTVGDKIQIPKNDVGRTGSCCTRPSKMQDSSEGPAFQMA